MTEKQAAASVARDKAIENALEIFNEKRLLARENLERVKHETKAEYAAAYKAAMGEWKRIMESEGQP